MTRSKLQTKRLETQMSQSQLAAATRTHHMSVAATRT